MEMFVNLRNSRFFTTMGINIAIFWEVAQERFVDRNRLFLETFCLRLQDRKVFYTEDKRQQSKIIIIGWTHSLNVSLVIHFGERSY
jgi:hypothetical protein